MHTRDAGDSAYAPSTRRHVRDQVDRFEQSNGAEGNKTAGKPVVVLTMVGAKTGRTRKVPLMRVERGGSYLAVGSDGGAEKDPLWVRNLAAQPQVVVQDGPDRQSMTARLLSGEERADWWQHAVRIFPPYAEYQTRTDRQIPLYLLEPAAARP
jgi:F420H(2)-dependent quinone reductase